MSLEAGAKRSAAGFPFLIWLNSKNNQWESGKPAFGFPLFHAEQRLWECGNRVVCDFQGLWARRKTCLWFSSASIARHFHSPSVSRAFLSPQFCKHLPFGFLHAPRGLSVTLGVGHSLYVRGRDLRPQVAGQIRYLAQDLPRRRVPAIRAPLFALGVG